MNNDDYITLHKDDDVRSLALKRVPEGVDIVWCLQQIEGRQLAKDKLPRWAATKGLWFPPRLSLEQCSGEHSALYKQSVLERLMHNGSERQRMVDITGGYGVDFSFIAPLFRQAVYIEKQEHLCEIARHNMPLLNLGKAQIVCQESSDNCALLEPHCSLIYADPARRDHAGHKTVAIEDCTPDIRSMMPTLLGKADYVMIKLSPMLDISMALRSLQGVCEVHVVSVRGECKELLLICSSKADGLKYYCVNLDTNDASFATESTRPASPIETAMAEDGLLLYEPNASILKAGVQDVVAQSYGLKKIHPQSNLFVGHEFLPHFPGRGFRIVAHSDFSKRHLKTLLCGLTQANITIRNFPTSVADLRRRLKLKEGGATFLFATTQADGSHSLIKCEKI